MVELLAWDMLFFCGRDYLDGLGDESTDAEKLAAAPEAWSRLGAAYMILWARKSRVETGGKKTPWAFDQFGAPPGHSG